MACDGAMDGPVDAAALAAAKGAPAGRESLRGVTAEDAATGDGATDGAIGGATGGEYGAAGRLGFGTLGELITLLVSPMDEPMGLGDCGLATVRGLFGGSSLPAVGLSGRSGFEGGVAGVFLGATGAAPPDDAPAGELVLVLVEDESPVRFELPDLELLVRDPPVRGIPRGSGSPILR